MDKYRCRGYNNKIAEALSAASPYSINYINRGLIMGTYINPGSDGFSLALRSEIYVDKTGLITFTNRKLNSEQRFICVSRPRRFGKSMAANMLAAYYDRSCDTCTMFENLEIAQDVSFRQNINRYNVVFLNMQDFLSMTENVDGMLELIKKKIIQDLGDEYNIGREENLVGIFQKVYAKTGIGFIFILDEWDCIFRERKHDTLSQRKYLDFLRLLFKDKTYVSLAYMTGILPIKKYGTHSALNMFYEYSMTDLGPLARFTGFTEDEVQALCVRYHMDFDEARQWYDGYRVGPNTNIYGPKSVVDAMLRGRFRTYWTQTETYEALRIYIDLNMDGLRDSVIRMLSGQRCRINTARFQNDMTSFKSKDDVLTLLVHLGYLAFDSESNEVYIPNYELETEFVNAIEGSGWKKVADALESSEQLLEAVLSGDAEAVSSGLQAVHMDIVSALQYNNENALSCAITLAFYSARKEYDMVRELPAGKGFADIVFIPRRFSRKPAIVVELKWGHSAKTAITQIRDKQYGKSLKEYFGEVVLVGVSYDKSLKSYQCVIERIDKSTE